MRDWVKIPGFSRYSVSRLGQVRNDDTGRILQPRVNQHGVVFVGLMRRGKQYQRGVARMVAEEFGPPPMTRYFDAAINLDGDRWNNRWDNVVWRPYWFAVEYNRQFKGNYPNRIENPLRDDAGNEYADSFQAAIKNGLLEKHVVLGVLNRDEVWPTYQFFEVVL